MNARIERKREPVLPDVERVEVADAHRQTERDERCDLREPRERRVEALDLALLRHGRVTEDDPRDEDGEEAGASDDRTRARR